MKTILITDEIRSAIIKAAEALGSQSELGSTTGVNPVYIGRYISGKNKRMSHEAYGKLLPTIMPYFSDEYHKKKAEESMFNSSYMSFKKNDLPFSEKILFCTEFRYNIIDKIISLILDDEMLDDSMKIDLRRKIKGLVFEYEKELFEKYNPKK